MTGSRRFRLPDAMSILARSTRDPSSNSPARIPLEQAEVLLDRPVAVGAVPTRLRRRAAVVPDLRLAQIADVRLAVPDELDGELLELLEVVGAVVEVLAPVPNQASERPR